MRLPSLRPLIVAYRVLASNETARLILASNRGVDFLKDEQTESELGEKEFYFIEGGRESAPRGREDP